jgi:hypothetical protein
MEGSPARVEGETAMRRLSLTGIAALGLLALLVPGRAVAQQYYGPGYGNYGRSGPALSPYLNLTRGGNPAANYYLGVLPEIDYRRTKATTAREITDLELRSDVLAQQQQQLAPEDVVGSLTGGGLPPSGHAAAFTSYGAYYGLAPPGSPAARLQSTQARGR